MGVSITMELQEVRTSNLTRRAMQIMAKRVLVGAYRNYIKKYRSLGVWQSYYATYEIKNEVHFWWKIIQQMIGLLWNKEENQTRSSTWLSTKLRIEQAYTQVTVEERSW